jgi:hypothetical protein
MSATADQYEKSARDCKAILREAAEVDVIARATVRNVRATGC